MVQRQWRSGTDGLAATGDESNGGSAARSADVELLEGS
jgi:hypothetical protein